MVRHPDPALVKVLNLPGHMEQPIKSVPPLQQLPTLLPRPAPNLPLDKRAHQQLNALALTIHEHQANGQAPR
jgi:hypothetical protein